MNLMLINGRSEEVQFDSKQRQRNYYFPLTNDMTSRVGVSEYFLGREKNARVEFSLLDPVHLAVLFSMFLKIDSMTTSLKRKVFPPSRQ